ncbi:MAG: transferrin-binding protein-like solute binding protein [Elusimicrobiales bacterium]
MTRRLFFILLSFQLAATAAATTITSSTNPEEDRITYLRDTAAALLERGGDTTLQEGEELVIKPGGSRGHEGPPQDLSKLVDAVRLEDLPDTLRILQQSQAQNLRELQDNFKQLNKLESVKPEDQQEFFKNVERQVALILEDKLILQGMRQKVTAALADPNLPADQKTKLTLYAKLITDTDNRVSSFQNEAAKLAKTRFKNPASPEDREKEVQSLAAEAQNAQSEVQNIMRELQAKPSGNSQDFFTEAADRVSKALSDMDQLWMKVADLLAKDPADPAALALQKQIAAYRTQSSILLKSLAVTEVDTSVIVEAQQIKDQLEDKKADLKARLAAIKAKDQKEVSKAEIEDLFRAYDEAAALEARGRALGEGVARAAAGQKFQTAEQLEMAKLLAGFSDAFLADAGLEDGLSAGLRDSAWAAYLKEEEESELTAQGGGPQLELSDDVTSESVYGQPPADRGEAARRLAGAVIGDVLVRDSVAYGVAVLNLRPTTLEDSALAGDRADLREGDLVVFRIEDGRYTSASLGTYQVYDGAPHAAVDINSGGDLAVFLNRTVTGDKLMQGELFTLDKGTLAQLTNATLDLGTDTGWFPRFDENGNLLSLRLDGGLEYSCVDAACGGGALTAGAFAAETEWLRALRSGGAYGEGLPAAALADRLSGVTATERLGDYSHLAWGRWNDGAGVADTIYTNSYWLAGSLTPDADVPVTGQATYAGQVLGKLTENGAISAITGTTALTADFASRSLTGIFDMQKDGAAWTQASVNAAWAAGANKIAGSLTADNNLTGAVNGNFFGPQADQVGGSWTLSGGADARAAGVFTGDINRETQ